MLWLAVMVLLILWLLGYGYEVAGNAIHLLLAAVAVLLLVNVLRSNAFRFRRHRRPDQPTRNTGVQACGSEPADSRFAQSCRALVVDDEATIRLTTRAILEVNGFQVQAASGVPEAIAALTATPFDLVVTDLKMETDTAGFDLAEFAAQRTPRPIVIVVSAYPRLATSWKQRGVHAFFEKPTDTSVLLRSIHELLARRDGAAAA